VIGTFSRDLAEVNLLLLDREFLGGLGLGRPGKKWFSKSIHWMPLWFHNDLKNVKTDV
jgi:hypothetical protein